jgi:hypothetical protein
MSDTVGQKGSIKRASEFLGEPVDGATQIESQGGVVKSMTGVSVAGVGLGPAGFLAGFLLGLGAQKAYDARQGKAASEPGEPIPVPRHAVLAVSRTAVHVIPASDTGRMKKGSSTLSIPLAEVATVIIDERKVVTAFKILLTSGQFFTGETKRLGANKHNIEVLRLLEARTRGSESR